MYQHSQIRNWVHLGRGFLSSMLGLLRKWLIMRWESYQNASKYNKYYGVNHNMVEQENI